MDVKMLVGKIKEKYQKSTERGWKEERMDMLESFFEEVSRTVEAHGAKVLGAYVAPNGYISFEKSGKTWTLDLLFGVFERHPLDVLMELLSKEKKIAWYSNEEIIIFDDSEN